MAQTNEYVAVSVESRKGGVGKTTTALNLAHMALKTHEVLYLDLDIAGTAAASIADAPIWRRLFHEVRLIGAVSDSPGVNLVDLFDTFMKGKEVGDVTFTKQGAAKTALLVSRGQINVLSSFLKRDHGTDGFDENAYDPSVLFDSMHSEWFVEMLRDIVSSFVEAVAPARRRDESRQSERSNRKALVVIDNAPGYSGFEPLIEDWLTDLGAERGKFLFVSSMDTQDIKACAEGLKDIHALFQSKWLASRSHDDETYEPANRAEKVFARRLAEATEDCPWSPQRSKENIPKQRRLEECANCELSAYCRYDHPFMTNGKAKREPDAKLCLGILVNRTPSLLLSDSGREYWDVRPLLEGIGLWQANDPTERVRLRDLAAYVAKRSTESPVASVVEHLDKRLVPYDEQIESQFFRLYPLGETTGRQSRHEPDVGRDDTARKLREHRKKVRDIIRWPKHPMWETLARDLQRALQAVNRIDTHIELCRQECTAGGHEWIDDFWHDGFYLSHSLARVLDSALGHEPRSPGLTARVGSAMTYELYKCATDLVGSDSMGQTPFLKLANEVNLDTELGYRLMHDVAITCAVSTVRSGMSLEHARPAFMALLGSIAVLGQKASTDPSSPMFWVKLALAEDLTDRASHAYMKAEQVTDVFRPEQAFESLGTFSEAIRAFCLAEARILSRGDDLRFLIDFLAVLTKSGMQARRSAGDLRALALEVVVERRRPHKEALLILKDVVNVHTESREDERKPSLTVQSIEIMHKYKEVLQAIVGEQWQLLT